MSTPAASERPIPANRRPGARTALKRYRFMAFFTGVMLLILTFVAIPMQIWAHNDMLVHIFGFIHGWGFIVYLLSVADMGLRLRWNLVRIVLVAVAGTVPFCSFIAEHFVSRDVQARLAASEQPADSLTT